MAKEKGRNMQQNPYVINYTYSLPPLVVSDKYTHPNTVIVKHNRDDKPHEATSFYDEMKMMTAHSLRAVTKKIPV